MKIVTHDLPIKKTGVYLIRNKQSNKIYVGSTQRSFISRINNHKGSLKRNCHPNKQIQSDYNLFGVDNFEIELLAICPPSFSYIAEQFYLDTLKPQYNTSKFALTSKGVKCKEETKKKISESNKLVYSCPEKRKLNTIRKKEAMNRPEVKEKIRESSKKYIYKILSPSGEIFECNFLQEFCKKYNLNNSSLRYTLEGIRPDGKKVKFAKGYKLLSKENIK